MAELRKLLPKPKQFLRSEEFDLNFNDIGSEVQDEISEEMGQYLERAFSPAQVHHEEILEDIPLTPQQPTHAQPSVDNLIEVEEEIEEDESNARSLLRSPRPLTDQQNYSTTLSLMQALKIQPKKEEDKNYDDDFIDVNDHDKKSNAPVSVYRRLTLMPQKQETLESKMKKFAEEHEIEINLKRVEWQNENNCVPRIVYGSCSE